MSKCGVIVTLVLTGIAAMLNFAAGIYILLTWYDNQWCWVWTLHDQDDDDYYRDDICIESSWAAIAFVDGFLFSATFVFLLIFVVRMDKVLAKRASGLAAKQQQAMMEGGVPVTLAVVPPSPQPAHPTPRAHVVDDKEVNTDMDC